MNTRSLCAVIDAGHGGNEDIGGSSANHAAGANGLLEKDVTLDVAQRVKGFLNGNTRVVLTREDSINLSLADRAGISRRNRADAFVSLHFNGASDPEVDGTEVWIARNAPAHTRTLARILVERVGRATGVTRGIRERNLGILLPNRLMPETAACLVEIGYLTNPRHARRLESLSYRDEIARAVAESIHDVLDVPRAFALGIPAITLSASVGKGGKNKPDDVYALKDRLRSLGFDWIVLDKKMDTDTIEAIKLFQSIVQGKFRVSGDGRVDVPGTTFDWLQAANPPRWELTPLGSAAGGFTNFERADTKDQHDYSTNWLCGTIIGAGATYRDDFLKTHASAPLISINDASLPHGGDTPDHAEHETGMQCDIQLARTDGKSGGIKTSDSLFDRDTMREQLKAFRAQPLFSRALLNDSKLIAEGLCKFAAGHDDHAHIDILPPALATITTEAITLDLGDGPPFLAKVTDACWDECQKLLKNAAKKDSVNKRSQTKLTGETGIKVDSDPYFGISKDEIEAVVRAGFHSRQMPEVLLALWAQEGSTRSVTAPREVSQATTEANAKSLFRSTVYFFDMGNDDFLDTTRPNPHADNNFDDSDDAAPAHETHFVNQVQALVKAGFLSEDISTAINTELTVATNAAGNFTVMPSIRFYALSLLTMDALFSQMEDTSFPELSSIPTGLNYIQWNMGQTGFGGFLKSAEKHRKEKAHLVAGKPISIEQWALHTKVKTGEWREPRRNAIKFLHFVNSYQPIFANSITSIKPGIEDLQKVTSHIAAVEDALDDRHHGSTLPYREAVEAATRIAMDAFSKWQSILDTADDRISRGLTPRVPFNPVAAFDKDEEQYKLLGKQSQFAADRKRLQAACAADLTWLFDIDSSAVSQIEDTTLRDRLLNKVDWKKVVYVGKKGNTKPAEELFTAMAVLVPERRVPKLVPLIDVDKKVQTVPGTKQSLFPEAKDAFVTMRDAAATTLPPGGSSGVTLDLASGWRSKDHQAKIKAAHPNPAAVAGQSSAHRYGLAADLNLSVSGLSISEISTASMTNILSMYRSPIYKWMFLYGAEFGWYPYRNEPWHWEYDPPGFPERFRADASK